MTDPLAKLREKKAGRQCWGCDHAPHPGQCPVGVCLCCRQTAEDTR